MGTKILLVIVCTATAAVTLLGGEAPATPRSARAARGEDPREEPRKEGAAEVARPRVVDDKTGDPVAGARLAFHARGADAVSGTTDEAGRFDFPEDDVWAVVVRADGYPPTMFHLSQERAEFRLDRGTIRTFTIVDEDGNPGAHAEVDVYGDRGLSILLSSEVADMRGVVTLWLGGRETVLVRLAGYAYEEAGDGERVVLHPGFSIGGQVVDTAGRPVEGASVLVTDGGG